MFEGLGRWNDFYSFEELIANVSSKIMKPPFVLFVEQMLESNGHQFLFPYEEMKFQDFNQLLQEEDIDSSIHMLLLYYVIDVFANNYKFTEIKTEPIDEFTYIAGLTYEQCNIVTSIWMLSNDHIKESSKIMDMLLINAVPSSLRFFILNQLVELDLFNEAYRFYKFFDLIPNDSSPEQAKNIIISLVCTGHLIDALEFVRSFAYPENIPKDSYHFLINEICLISKKEKRMNELYLLPFSPKEKDMVKNAMKKYNAFTEEDLDDFNNSQYIK